MYLLTCPHCGHQMKVRVARSGAMAKCLACFQSFEVNGRTARVDPESSGSHVDAIQPTNPTPTPSSTTTGGSSILQALGGTTVPLNPQSPHQQQTPRAGQHATPRPTARHRDLPVPDRTPQPPASHEVGGYPTDTDNLNELLKSSGAFDQTGTQTIQTDPNERAKFNAARRKARRTRNMLIAIFAPLFIGVIGYFLLIMFGVLGGTSDTWQPPQPGEAGLPPTPVAEVMLRPIPVWQSVSKKLNPPVSGVIGMDGL